jgi:hypothetical protein
MQKADYDSMSNQEYLQSLTEELWKALPISRFPHGLGTYEYMWKYKISLETYTHLLLLVNKLDLSNRKSLKHEIEGYYKGSTNVARVITLIICEWYKRNSDSLDGDGAMNLFTFRDYITAKDIWEAAGFDNELLHKAKKANLRQTAMCVLGGFPLKYVNQAESRFERLINKLSDDEDETSEGSWNELFDGQNTVFSGSLKSGSCKEYVDALWKYMETEDISYLPFHETDLQLELFKSFCTHLKNGYGEKLKKDFFKETHIIYTNDDDVSVQAQLNLQIGFKKDNHILYASQLLRIEPSLDFSQINKLAFFLRVVNSDGTDKDSALRYYRRVGNGRNDFVCVGLSPLCVEYDLFNIDRIDLYCQNVPNGEARRLKTIKVGMSLELYESTRAYCWTSKKQPYARKALLLDHALFQDFRNLSPSEKRSEDSDAARPVWVWLYQRESLVLTDVSGEKHPFKSGNLQPVQVVFSYSGLDKDIRIRDGRVDSVSLDGSSPIRLLYGNVLPSGKSLNIYVLSMLGGRIKKSDSYYLEYKEKDSFRYKEWTDRSGPSQGFISIRVTTKAIDRLPYTADVYYLPSSHPVERNLTEHEISFKEVSSISRYDPVSESAIDIEGPIKDPIPDENDDNVPETIAFRVGDEANYIILEVFRAFYMQEFIIGGMMHRFFSEEKQQVPVLLHKGIKIKSIGEEGCQTTLLNDINYRVNNEFGDGFLSHPKRLCSSIAINKAVDVYVYKNMIVDGDRLKVPLPLQEKDEYHFYYWNGDRNTQPELISSSYDKESGLLSLDCSSYNANRGVIFQSLKECRPRHYYRPFYIRNGTINEGVPPFVSTDTRSYLYTMDDLAFCYQLYREHKVYAAVLSPLIELRRDKTCQKYILEHALKQSGYKLNKDDVFQLNRLCSEIGFDWMLIPRRDVLSIASQSGKNKPECIQSIRRLFEGSVLIKKSGENNRYEYYYFKRIFINKDDYFDKDIRFNDIFKRTRYKEKKDARTFIELISGKNIPYTETSLFIKSVTDPQGSVSLFQDVFYQFVIEQ